MRRVSQSASQRKDGNFTVKLVAKKYISQREREKLESHQNRQFIPATTGLEKFFTRGLCFKIHWWICTAIPRTDLELQGMFLLTNSFIHPSLFVPLCILYSIWPDHQPDVQEFGLVRVTEGSQADTEWRQVPHRCEIDLHFSRLLKTPKWHKQSFFNLDGQKYVLQEH